MEPITIAVVVVLGVVVGVPLLRGFWREIGGARGAGKIVGGKPAPRRRRADAEDEDEDEDEDES